MTSRQRLLVLGGTGFVGRAFAAAWAALPADTPGRPALLRVPSRRPAAARALASLPGVELLPADVHDPAALRALLEGCDAVLNLVAILHGTPAEFERVHVALPAQLAEAAQAAGVRRLLHVSALGVPAVEAGAAPDSAPSHYLRSKARGERVLRAADGLALTVLRPSVIFGAEDHFIRLFAALQALLPVMALAGAQARFQPVWVGDVARALLAVLADPASAGRTYELAGPQVCSLIELVRAAGRWSGRQRPVLPLPDWAGRLQAAALGLLPGPPLLTADNLDSMRVPNVATGRHPGLAELGLVPTRMEDVMPAVWQPAAQRLDRWRARAGR